CRGRGRGPRVEFAVGQGVPHAFSGGAVVDEGAGGFVAPGGGPVAESLNEGCSGGRGEVGGAGSVHGCPLGSVGILGEDGGWVQRRVTRAGIPPRGRRLISSSGSTGLSEHSSTSTRWARVTVRRCPSIRARWLPTQTWCPAPNG